MSTAGALAAGALQRSRSTPPRPPAFHDLAQPRGLDFTHLNGASPQRFFPEIMGSGALFLDFDNDGWLDAFLVDGGSFADPAVARRARHRVFRNRGNGTFEDVTAASGIRHREYGMGACAGAIDNDGLIDLYITNVGTNALYRNAGNSRFIEIPKGGGAAGDGWSTSCAFVDIDRDGYVDLFVTNYVDTQHAQNEFCGVSGPPAIRDYCHPLIYAPLTNTVYRNTGRGTFQDISAQAGVADYKGNGLGVAVSDIDADGWPDVFVANDSMPNFLFHNERNGTFTEIAARAGVAVAADGKARAGMGTVFASFGDSGLPDLVVTNHETEMHSLFRNLGGNLFSDNTVSSGMGPATRPYVGFGVVAFDYDNDTSLDLAVVNGNVTVNAGLVRAGAKVGQRNLLMRNSNGRFLDMKDAAGPGFSAELVSRGLAAGDIDNDGDLDLLISNNGAAASLLVNDASTSLGAGGAAAGNALIVRAIGSKSNRSAIGAKVAVTIGTRRLRREVQSGSSYLGQNDLRVHFGLGGSMRADRVDMTWPDGTQERFDNVAANQIVTIEEGNGIVGRMAFVR
jgi:hypothetical protein